MEPSKSPERLADYAARWIESRPIRPRTAELYRLQFRLHIDPVLGSHKVSQLRPQHIPDWHSILVKHSGLHPTTVAKVYRLLRSILNTAVEDKLLEAKPCRIKKSGAERSKERPVPTIDQVEAIGSFAFERGVRVREG